MRKESWERDFCVWSGLRVRRGVGQKAYYRSEGHLGRRGEGAGARLGRSWADSLSFQKLGCLWEPSWTGAKEPDFATLLWMVTGWDHLGRGYDLGKADLQSRPSLTASEGWERLLAASPQLRLARSWWGLWSAHSLAHRQNRTQIQEAPRCPCLKEPRSTCEMTRRKIGTA